MNIRIAAYLVLAVAACSTGPSPATAPRPTSVPAPAPSREPGGVIAIRIPQRVAAFVLKNRHQHEDQDLGYQLRYEGPVSLLVDVFVYPGPDLVSRCLVPCARGHLTNEIDLFEKGFPEMIGLGYFKSIEVTKSEPLIAPAGVAWLLGHHLSLAVNRDGLDQRSEFYLYYLPGYRVKVRATFVDDPTRVEHLRAFLEALVPALLEGEEKKA